MLLSHKTYFIFHHTTARRPVSAWLRVISANGHEGLLEVQAEKQQRNYLQSCDQIELEWISGNGNIVLIPKAGLLILCQVLAERTLFVQTLLQFMYGITATERK